MEFNNKCLNNRGCKEQITKEVRQTERQNNRQIHQQINRQTINRQKGKESETQRGIDTKERQKDKE